MGTGKGRRRFAVVIAMALATAACGGGGDDTGDETASSAGGGGEPYLLGYNGSLSGAFAGATLGNLVGVQSYFDVVNRQGGIDGHPIELDVRDDRLDVQVAVGEIRDLAEKGVPVILGHTSSVVWATTSSLAEELEVPQIATAAVDANVYPPRPYLYRSFMSAKQAAEGQLRFVADNAEVERPRVAAIRYESAGTDDWEREIKEGLDRLGLDPLLTSERFPAASTDVSPAAAAVAASNPDWVVASLNDPHVPLVVDALRNRGYEGPIVNWVGSSEELFAAVDDPELYIVRDVVPPQLEQSAPLREAAEAAGLADDLDDFSTTGYLSAKLVVEALRLCGYPCSGSELEAALEEAGPVDTEGMAGPGYGDVDGENHLFTRSVSVWRKQPGEPTSAMVGDWFEPSV